MRRREALTIVLGGAAAPLAARVQTGALQRPLRVAITTRQSRSASFIVALQDRLRELGYVDGENLALDVRLIVGGDRATCHCACSGAARLGGLTAPYACAVRAKCAPDQKPDHERVEQQQESESVGA